MYPIFLHKAPPLAWRAQEVVREVNHRPQLLVRVTVGRGYFPHRAAVPFMRIVLDNRQVRHAWFTEISGDASELNGYFATDLPAQGVIEFGYDGEVFGRVPQGFDAKPVHRLDRKRLPKGVVEPTEAEINPS